MFAYVATGFARQLLQWWQSFIAMLDPFNTNLYCYRLLQIVLPRMLSASGTRVDPPVSTVNNCTIICCVSILTL